MVINAVAVRQVLSKTHVICSKCNENSDKENNKINMLIVFESFKPTYSTQQCRVTFRFGESKLHQDVDGVAKVIDLPFSGSKVIDAKKLIHGDKKKIFQMLSKSAKEQLGGDPQAIISENCILLKFEDKSIGLIMLFGDPLDYIIVKGDDIFHILDDIIIQLD